MDHIPGVQLGDTFIPMDELNSHAARVATGLSELGVGLKDTVAIMMRNDVPFLVTGLAARQLGAYPVPINWHLTGPEVEYILQNSSAKVLVVHDDILRGIGEDCVPEDVHIVVVNTPEAVGRWYNMPPSDNGLPERALNWDDWSNAHEPWTDTPAFETSSIVYTSGTTGRPKGVRRQAATPEQQMEMMMSMALPMGLAPGFRTVIPAPLYHTVPNVCAGAAIQMGGFLALMPRFDPEELLRIIDTHKITHLQMVPTMFARLLQLPGEICEKYDVSSLQGITHSAAPCAPKIKKAMIDWWGPIINESYGATELGFITYATSEDALKYPGTVGKALPHADIKVLDEDDNEVPTGEKGTIYARYKLFQDFTYVGDDDKRQSIERQGLVTCGDIGYFNDEGYLFLCDRAADMIIAGGVNIYPAEIEAALIMHEDVRDCAVFGIPDDDMGEAVAAFIEPREGATLTAEEIQAYLREHIAKYKIPKLVEFRDELPREDTGKLFKRKLRDPFWADVERKI